MEKNGDESQEKLLHSSDLVAGLDPFWAQSKALCMGLRGRKGRKLRTGPLFVGSRSLQMFQYPRQTWVQ